MADPGTERARSPAGLAFPIGRLLGVTVAVDLSVLVIFALVVLSLATGAFPAWHPGWSAALRWGTAVGAGLLFFASIVVHELAHTLVARAKGIPVPRITLFLFGGISEMEHEPETPGTELLVAIVGPLTSMLLGAVFGVLGLWGADPGFADQLQVDPARAMAGIGPAGTALLWLSPVNFAIGVFNLLPAFPLDGGRVLRAILWAATRDVVRATRWATAVGQGFGWALVAWGFLQAMRGMLLGGVWLGLIGLFLTRGARAGYAQVVVKRALAGVRVRDLMRTHFETTEPDLTLQSFLDEHVLRSGQTVWPVVDDGGFRGVVTFDQAVAVPAALRSTHHVAELLPASPEAVPPEAGGTEALTRLIASGREALAVLDHGRLVGLLHSADVARWLLAHEAGATT